MMLLITRDDGTFSKATVRLQGRLEGAWGNHLQNECAALLGYFADVVVDLSEVSGVDREGLRALHRIHRRGVRLVGTEGIVPGLLESEGVPVGRPAIRTA